jgi:hypothetical protein
MRVTREFKLERQAKKGGGDRYQQVEAAPGAPSISQTIYIDQEVSRIGARIAGRLLITVETPEEVKE